MRVAVFGLGIFGRNVAKALFEKGHEVIAVDQEKDLIQKAQEYATQAIVANCTDRELLENLGLNTVDLAVVSLGENLSASILLTLYLREMEVKQIIVKAVNEDHQKILEMVGATKVIFPERDMAIKLAASLDTPNVLDYLPLSQEYQVIEMAAPKAFVDKSLKDLDLRRKYGIQVIAVRESGSDTVHCLFSPEFKIKEGDILIILGKVEDIEKVKKLVS
ncbi:MAG: TrkA family potassium uptake protein [Candidatus Desulfofervidaceae bacterium]|nr:TrkA family potassium uptake protein [Candidatus Desulfofervidaceae bacterium]MDL1970692.1 TrkA family potassium uptake protein [Candidatus Desulfofervidaceae bacterium]